MDRGLKLTTPDGSERRRLLLVVQLPPPVHGASVVNQQVVNSAELRKFFTCTVVRLDATLDLAEIRKFSFLKVFRSLRTFWRVAWVLSKDKPDLVYLTMAPKGLAFYRDAVLVFMFRWVRVRHILHFHGRGLAQMQRSSLASGFARAVLKRATIIHLSPSLMADIAPFVHCSQVRFVANGVPDIAAKLQHELHGDHRSATILFLGTMLESKGALVLLAALTELRRRGTSFQALFAGPWRGSLTREEFEREVNQSGLAEQVRHLGAVYGEEKDELLRSGDIFAFPTHYENEAFPLVVLEAMAAGLVPVTSNIAALPAIVAEAGLTVPPKDPEALADALQKLIDNPIQLAQLKKMARARYLANFTLQHFERNLAATLVWAIDADTVRANDKIEEMQT